jgi:hypothetical protein
MDEKTLIQLGVGGTLAILLLREVFAFLREIMKKDTGDDDREEIADCLGDIHQRLNDLHRWHDVRDPSSGVFVWYASFGNATLMETLVAIGDNVRMQTEVLRSLLEIAKENKADLKRVTGDLQELKIRLKRGTEEEA